MAPFPNFAVTSIVQFEKNTYMKQLFLSVCLIFALTTLQGQTSFQPDPVVDLNFSMGFPVGEFGNTAEDIGFGLDMGMYFPLSPRANWLKMGPQFMFLSTGSNTQRQTQFIDITLGGQVINTIQVPMRIVSGNSVLGGHMVFRAQAPLNGYVEPYLQGMAGFRRLATTIRIFDDSPNGFFNPDPNGLITRSTPLSSWVFSYGGGGGMQIRLSKYAFLNLGANLLFGGEADYYTKNDIKNFQFVFNGGNYNPNNPNLNEDNIDLVGQPTRSKTAIIQANLGLTMMIRPK